MLGNDDPAGLHACEILPSREFYDYEDKYELNLARTVLPPDLPEDEIAEMRRLAVECYQGRGVRRDGPGRFPARNRDRKLYINEINTIPGFTSISMYPEDVGIFRDSVPELIDRLIELALERHAAKKATRFTR